MKNIILFLTFCLTASMSFAQRRTVVSIEKGQFYINGRLTYEGRSWEGHKIAGLLMNSRMVQGIFDDLNPNDATRAQFAYPDTQMWDPNRNTDEFVAAMPLWKSYGLNAFTLNLQGGSPTGYGNSTWVNSAFDEKGDLRPAYTKRLERILDEADELNMVVILGYFYFGQDQHLTDEAAVIRAVDNATDWIFKKGYRNLLIEVDNECDIKAYDHEILKPARVNELITRIQSKKHKGYRLLVSTSYGGGVVPRPNVVAVADYLLLHGNSVKDPAKITQMVENTRAMAGYQGQPIVFNEDDHFDFDKAENNFVNAVKAYASWGYFDYRIKGEGFAEGYQSIPTDWGIDSDRKKGFFNKLKEITGGL